MFFASISALEIWNVELETRGDPHEDPPPSLRRAVSDSLVADAWPFDSQALFPRVR